MDIYKNIAALCFFLALLFFIQVIININYIIIKKEWKQDSKIIVKSFKQFFILVLFFLMSVGIGIFSHLKNMYMYDINLSEYTKITYIGEPIYSIENDRKIYTYSNNKFSITTTIESQNKAEINANNLRNIYEEKGYKNVKYREYRSIYIFEFSGLHFTKLYIYSDSNNIYFTVIEYKKRNILLDLTLNTFHKYIKIEE